MKIAAVIPDNNAEMNALIDVLEAAWAAGATGVTIEREPVVMVDIRDVSGISCGAADDCSMCEEIICTPEQRKAKRQCRIYQLQQRHSEQELALAKTAEELRLAVIHE